MPIGNRWLCTAILILVVWVFAPRSTKTTDYWPTPQIDFNDYRYQYKGESLINTTALFASPQLNPLLRSLLSKSFGNDVYGAQVIPFFRKKTDQFAGDQITLITWLTSDRLGRLVSLAESRKSPISAVFYVPPEAKLATRALVLLDHLYATKRALSSNVDIHLVTSNHLLHHNTWRNIARAFSLTDWVMLWDADFEPCTDYQAGFESFRARERGSGRAEELERGKAGLIIPPFEWTDPVEPQKRGICPADKKELAVRFRNLSMDTFEPDNPILSHATDYPRYFAAADSGYYAIADYEVGYEAYIIHKKDIDIWYDERFVGFGYDRSAYTAQFYLSGMDLYVMTDQYAVHVEHPYGNTLHAADAMSAKIPWRTFRMDLCHSLADHLAIRGKLHGAEGERLMSNCQAEELPELTTDLIRLLGVSDAYELEHRS